MALAVAPAHAAVPAPQPPVRFSIAFGDGARLGSATSMAVRVGVAPGQDPVTEVRILTPAGIDLSSSGLGMATCARPEPEFIAVMNSVTHGPCPGNALMGTGVATAELRFDPAEIFGGAAQLALYSGESVGDKPGLIVIADAYRPIRTQLIYRGYLYIPPPGFGVGMAIQVKQVLRPPFGAPVALSTFQLVVGSSDLRYVRTTRGRLVSYHPRGIPLPAKCPAEGFRFRVIVRLAKPDGQPDGPRFSEDAIVPCPQQ